MSKMNSLKSLLFLLCFCLILTGCGKPSGSSEKTKPAPSGPNYVFIGEDAAYKIFIDTSSVKSTKEGNTILAEALVKYEYTPSGKRAMMIWLDAHNYLLDDFRYLTYTIERIKISHDVTTAEYKQMIVMSDLFNNEGRSLETFNYTKTTKWKTVEANSTLDMIAHEIINKASN